MFKFVKFAELPVTDQDRAVAFYTEKLGLRVAQDSPYQDGWRWIELEIPGAQTRIMLTHRAVDDTMDTPRLVLMTEDVEAVFRTLSAKGVLFTKEPRPAPWDPARVFAQIRDSEGNGVVIQSE